MNIDETYENQEYVESSDSLPQNVIDSVIMETFEASEEFIEKYTQFIEQCTKSMIEQVLAHLADLINFYQYRPCSAATILYLCRWTTLRLMPLTLTTFYSEIAIKLRKIFLIHHHQITLSSDDANLLNFTYCSC